MKNKYLILCKVFLISLIATASVGAFAESDNIFDYYKQTCQVRGSGEEMSRDQFLRVAYSTARQKKHCVIAFLKNGGYVYDSKGYYLDDFTPLSKQPKNCIVMNCL